MWHQVQADERRPRRPAEVQELQGNVLGAPDRALTPPVPQGMQQQTVQVVALGVPVVQHMREPSMGYPNNILYIGQAVGSSAQ